MHTISNSDSLLDRLNKEKYRYKLYQELVEFAKDGAVKIIDGGIAPINPEAHLSSQIFIYGSLVFTFTEESPYHYKTSLTGAPTAKMMNCELLNLSELDKIKFPELHLQHTIILKYKGFSLIAQTMIPGKKCLK